MTADQRRIPFVRRCRLEPKAGDPCEGLLCNLSVLGVYVTVDPIPALGSWLTVSFALPGNEALVSVEAMVSWCNTTQNHKVHSLPPGCGLRFLTLTLADKERIQRLVDTYIDPKPG